ncbi:MAG TPA: hypothetical protein VM802_12515 [Chitinophaga sp.]|uniref:hypothetical protein n=1 Tax=Chitinophaga sp. TaxID=1869181 RepID=UPI002C80CC18|nr:hypothetical protein [Chitinophaga sp.]HVI45690.1 hypothetical protein [Chitinophaga sp.]
MKKIFYLTLAVILVSCNQKDKSSRFDNEENTGSAPARKTNTTTAKKKSSDTAPILGERTASGTVICNKPGGDVVATLQDYVPLRCAPQEKGCYPVSVDFDITQEEYAKPLFRKGRKLKINGTAAGVLERDTKLPVATNGEKMWATVNGYTEKKNIRGGSIVETALSSFLKQHKGRSIADLQPFIHNFNLEEEKTLKPYTLYFNYESGIDDPSPLYRIALVCQSGELLGIIHSRPLELDGSTSRKLQRGFTIHFLNGIDNTLKEDFCKKFNKFILSVD